MTLDARASERHIYCLLLEEGVSHNSVDIFELLKHCQSRSLFLTIEECSEVVLGVDHWRLVPEDVWGIACSFEASSIVES
jgi:fructoselysine-6-P-deglycase FrlB-like protein